MTGTTTSYILIVVVIPFTLDRIERSVLIQYGECGYLHRGYLKFSMVHCLEPTGQVIECWANTVGPFGTPKEVHGLLSVVT